ncbi:MAG: SGNH/GDSL hydrolase family protein [Alcanivoracaceae bacterium]|nr:SGNH/GDSL hydrolase family protein [Alcanivoracaceae bacterium]
MNNIVLLGDSIFDNAEYVDQNDSVIEQLNASLSKDFKATLLAVDGNITSDVYNQLELLPDDTTHAFLSIGGNDALRVVNVLQQSSSTVGEAMEVFTEIRLDFQKRYRELITQIKQKVDQLTICTVHDCIPDIEPRSLTALSLFNEIILKEAISIGTSIIDLRLLCNEKEDYSSISPIEPSGQGAKKIVEQIVKVIKEHDFNNLISHVYK